LTACQSNKKNVLTFNGIAVQIGNSFTSPRAVRTEKIALESRTMRWELRKKRSLLW